MRHFLIIFVLLLSACVSQPQQKGFKDPDDFDPVAAAKTRISLGLTYLKNGNYSQAKFNLDKALQFAPKLADSHFSMAYYYQLVGENIQAEKEYKAAMEMAPNNADIINTYGTFLCQQGKYPKAKEYFLKAVQSDNYVSSAETYENLALCSQKNGYVGESIEYLKNALNHQPGRAKSLLLLSEMLVNQQRWEEARQTLRRYEKVARVSAETLWFSTEIEQALGNNDLAQGYGDMLVRMYPRHPLTAEYLKAGRKVPEKKSVAKTQANTLTKKPATMSAGDATLAATSSPQSEQAMQTATAKILAQSQADKTDKDTSTQRIPQPKVAEAQAELTENNQSQQKNEVGPIYHVVQKDENLYRISLQYNIRMQRLIEWNKLPNASAIYAGKKLLIIDPNSIE